MTPTLTPPADSPLPWSVDSYGHRPVIRDATGEPMLVDMDRARYLVAAANAAPGLVAERDALREMNAAWSQWCWSQRREESQRRLSAAEDALAAVQMRQPVPVGVSSLAASPLVALETARDTALARVAEMEAENARLLELLDWAAERLHPLDSDEVRRREDAIINGKDVTP